MPFQFAISVYAAPAEEPITATEAKSHARVDTSADDTLITAMIVAARQEAESWLRRYLVTQTIDMYMDAWPCANYLAGHALPIYLLGGPAQSVSSVQYRASDGTLTTWASTNYHADLVSITPRIVLADGVSYPTLQVNRPNAIQIRYITGYGAASTVPAAIKTALAMRVADMYEHREARLDSIAAAEDNPTWTALLSPYRITDFRFGG